MLKRLLTGCAMLALAAGANAQQATSQIDWYDPDNPTDPYLTWDLDFATSVSEALEGSGTVNAIPVWSDTDTLTDSPVTVDGTNVGVNTATPSYDMDVAGDFNTSAGGYRIGASLVLTSARVLQNIVSAFIGDLEISGNLIEATDEGGISLLDNAGNGLVIADGGAMSGSTLTLTGALLPGLSGLGDVYIPDPDNVPSSYTLLFDATNDEWVARAASELTAAESDPIFSVMDTEAELEAHLTDVTNVFTNNDGALTADDITDDVIGDLSNVEVTGAATSDSLVLDATGDWRPRPLTTAYLPDAYLLNTGDSGTGTYNITGQANFDNLRLDGNTISATAGSGVTLGSTVNPTSDLQIGQTSGGTNNGNILFDYSDSFPAIFFQKGTTTEFLIAGNTASAAVAAIFDIKEAGGTVLWRGSTGTEIMRILETGNIGMGSTTPDRKLDVLSTSGFPFRTTYTDGTHYVDYGVDSAGDATIDPSGGDLTVDGDVMVDDLTIDTGTLFYANYRWSDMADSGVVGGAIAARPTASGNASRIYSIPNGSPSGTRAKMGIFGTDYWTNPTNYWLFDIFTDSSNDIYLQSRASGSTAPKPITIQFDDSGVQTDAVEFAIDGSVSWNFPQYYDTYVHASMIASFPVNVTKPIAELVQTSDVTLTATPSIGTATAVKGQMLTIINTGTNNLTIQDESNLAGSAVQTKSGSNITITPHSAWDFVYDGTYWCER